MSEFDSRLFDLIPHRPPMLLINRIVDLGGTHSRAEVDIDTGASFYVEGRGVPAWVGLEYMGQTAALIAGFQQQQGTVGPHLGFLLGTRRYVAQTDWFEPGTVLQVACREVAVVGDSLANFDCEIKVNTPDGGAEKLLAQARLSVFRKQVESQV